MPAPLLFCGDTLFSAGCGRLFEGTPAQMIASLARLAALPADTQVCCTHEYTLSNLRFAAAVEPGNAERRRLRAALPRAARRRHAHPALVDRRSNAAINPFLRCDAPEVVGLGTRARRRQRRPLVRVHRAARMEEPIPMTPPLLPSGATASGAVGWHWPSRPWPPAAPACPLPIPSRRRRRRGGARTRPGSGLKPSAAPAVEAAARRRADVAACGTAAPRARLDPEQDAERSDLWQRVRDGYAHAADLDDDLVRKWEQYYAGRPDYVQRMTERGGRYLFHIVEEVERRGMPSELALLPFIESAFNPQAVSSARASGMWQFMPATGKRLRAAAEPVPRRPPRRAGLDPRRARLPAAAARHVRRLAPRAGGLQLGPGQRAARHRPQPQGRPARRLRAACACPTRRATTCPSCRR